MTYNPPASDVGLIAENTFDIIAGSLSEQGWLVLDDVFPRSMLTALLAELADLPGSDLSDAGVGRSGSFEVNQSVRKDKTHWIDSAKSGQSGILLAMESLRLGINRRLFMGLFDYEAHFAVYEPGAFYKKHRDAFRGQKNRILTTVLYLNEKWVSGDGGELVIYHDSGETVQTVLPVFGRLVIFLSEEFPHEVMPTKRLRTSIAGWFRANQSSFDRVDPPK